jgi:hypothetical protein
VSKVITFFTGIALAVGLYAWWWNGQMQVVADKFDTAFVRLLPPGSTVSYSLHDSGGFPFRINHQLRAVLVTIPDDGSYEIDSLELIHQPWTDGHMVIHIEGDVRRLDDKGGLVWTLSAGKNLASIVGYTGEQAQFDIDMRDIVVQTKSGEQLVPELRYHAKTSGYFGDNATEVVLVTQSEDAPDLF